MLKWWFRVFVVSFMLSWIPEYTFSFLYNYEGVLWRIKEKCLPNICDKADNECRGLVLLKQMVVGSHWFSMINRQFLKVCQHQRQQFWSQKEADNETWGHIGGGTQRVSQKLLRQFQGELGPGNKTRSGSIQHILSHHSLFLRLPLYPYLSFCHSK